MTTRATVAEGVRVLVLEDDYYLAIDMQRALRAAGATVVGPFGDEAEATRAIAEAAPACAFIDVNLGRGPSFHVPRRLVAANIPFAFVTGYDAEIIPEEFAGVPRLEKPLDVREVAEAMTRLLARPA